MKRTYQIIKDIAVKKADTSSISSGEANSVTTTERLKDGYARVAGLFFVSHANTNDLAGVHVSLKIAQQEVLPTGFDASLITFSTNIAQADCTLDLSKENIPARSSELEVTVEKTTATTDRAFDIYVILEND